MDFVQFSGQISCYPLDGTTHGLRILQHWPTSEDRSRFSSSFDVHELRQVIS